MPYIYNDEDNYPMIEDPFTGFHNPTVYTDRAEMKAWERGETEPEQKPDNGCWNCLHYNGDACMKEWNNLDPCYYIPDRDDKDPQDYCEDHETDHNAVWEDFFGGNEP